MNNAVWLRRVLLADALVSGATGLLMALGGGLLSNLLDLPQALLRYAGLFLLPYALFVGYLGTRVYPARPAVWAVIGANLLWTLDSLLMLLLGWVQPNLLGYGFVIAQAVVVGLFAELQFVGLRRMAAHKRERSVGH
jgi:hypothetical protein